MDPFVGQIKAFGFGFNPRGYALCNGQLLAIQQYQALYSLLGVQFGGNGTNNFGLPDLRGRVPVGADPAQSDYVQGHIGGVESVTLTTTTIPAHVHAMYASSAAAAFPLPGTTSCLAEPGNWGSGTQIQLYGEKQPTTPVVALASDAIASTGGGQPHPNMQPYQVLNFCIALLGTYPMRN